MALILDENNVVEENAFLFEERLKSPVARFTDKNYILTDYFHIINGETTADPGWNDIEEILGERSPVRFQVIHDFPMSLSEPININTTETDVGLDGEYTSTATTFPTTITPLENDHFIIKQLNDSYIFRIIEVKKDAAMADGFHEITFLLEYIDTEKEKDLEKQTTTKTTCLPANIGSNEKCIIEDSYHEELREINKMYTTMVDNYVTFFYNEKHNCLLGDWENGMKLFDPFQQEFCHKHHLFRAKNQLDNIVLTEQFEDPRRRIKYENSIYRFVETKNMGKLSTFPFITFLGMNNKQTSFARWYDKKVMVCDIIANMPQDAYTMLSQETTDIIRMNYPTESKYLKFIANYFHKDTINLSEVDLTLGEELLVLRESNLEVFLFTPIILYIIRQIEADFMARRK